ncbi:MULTISPECIES: hypothetical protein [unclassified Fusibacter]|uniref:hypothetical protein n=1 Tax=unclassified Fusibacter TaxID=2624464 RepID=UPI001013B0CD|nr:MULTISPECIES: hypothetical protein [unclassified Fusibacter]MCK8061659.1 hypothetical protein [Fusibacter sp. A2]NPE23843.1 hypothetical protein [Fusibacter sp. A1]RXV58616.1 hypothetical protein DWB64_18830 [Fusibacter sp. A1]
MRHENKKIGKIVDELTTFFLTHGANTIEMELKSLDDRIDIIFHIDHLNENDRIVKMFSDLINVPREEDFDEYYWSLAGESDHDTELTLVGYMMDEVKFYHKEESFAIKLTRYKEK